MSGEYLLGLAVGLVLGGWVYRAFSRANQTLDKILRGATSPQTGSQDPASE